tara:strand:+ start:400 stop:774 length:375 start_codon:yes stop_codon:yes gene_type:complete
MTDTRIWVIRVDAHTKEITGELQEPSLKNLYKVLKTEMIQAVRLYSYPNVYMLMDENARVWCDEERLFFSLDEWVLVNRVVLVGIDSHGDWCSVDLKTSDIKPRVNFLPIDYIDEPITMQIVEL